MNSKNESWMIPTTAEHQGSVLFQRYHLNMWLSLIQCEPIGQWGQDGVHEIMVVSLWELKPDTDENQINR